MAAKKPDKDKTKVEKKDGKLVATGQKTEIQNLLEAGGFSEQEKAALLACFALVESD